MNPIWTRVAPDVVEQDADHHEGDGPPQRVLRLPAPRRASRLPGREGERHRAADHEHEGRLDEVPVDRPFPRHVLVLHGQPVPHAMPFQRVEDAAAQEREHDETAVGIERLQPGGARGGHRGRSGRKTVSGMPRSMRGRTSVSAMAQRLANTVRVTTSILVGSRYRASSDGRW